MTEQDARRVELLADHQPARADDGYVTCCECGYGADRLVYGEDRHAKHQDAVVTIAELDEIARRWRESFAAMSAQLAERFRNLTATERGDGGGGDDQ